MERLIHEQQEDVEADLVTGVPESGNAAALGYSLESGTPYGTAFVKNSYVGRTFIKPGQSSRESSVRGTTSGRIVQMLRDAGALEVHMRISSPPFLYPCYFGTDVPVRERRIASLYRLFYRKLSPGSPR